MFKLELVVGFEELSEEPSEELYEELFEEPCEERCVPIAFETFALCRLAHYEREDQLKSPDSSWRSLAFAFIYKLIATAVSAHTVQAHRLEPKQSRRFC